MSEQVRDIQWIQTILPHRYPMLLVDRVLEMEPDWIVAIKNVTINEEVLQGHFPGHPVLPGVMVVEGMAQAGGILVGAAMTEEERTRKLLYFSAIERARFRAPVVPGDQLRYEVKMVWNRLNTSKLEARALVDGKVVAQANLTSSMVDR